MKVSLDMVQLIKIVSCYYILSFQFFHYSTKRALANARAWAECFPHYQIGFLQYCGKVALLSPSSCLCVSGLAPRASHMSEECSTTELCPLPTISLSQMKNFAHNEAKKFIEGLQQQEVKLMSEGFYCCDKTQD